MQSEKQEIHKDRTQKGSRQSLWDSGTDTEKMINCRREASQKEIPRQGRLRRQLKQWPNTKRQASHRQPGEIYRVIPQKSNRNPKKIRESSNLPRCRTCPTGPTKVRGKTGFRCHNKSSALHVRRSLGEGGSVFSVSVRAPNSADAMQIRRNSFFRPFPRLKNKRFVLLYGKRRSHDNNHPA